MPDDELARWYTGTGDEAAFERVREKVATDTMKGTWHQQPE